MKGWQFCALLAFIQIAPHIPPGVAAAGGVIWLANAALWYWTDK